MINSVFRYPLFRIDGLNGFVVWGIVFFSLLTIIYSIKFMRGKVNPLQYYTYILLTFLASLVAVLANDLLVLLMAWGFLGLTLYLLINLTGDDKSRTAAKKTFIIVGGSDALMLLGIGIIYYLTGTFQMDKIRISLSTYQLINLSTFAYLCLAIACFAKAGAIPLHSWIPDCASSASVPVTAFLPASLDKLLGIYLLARISLNLFVMNPVMNMFLMLIGAVTILAAVMMALIQHNLKRLLGYHAVSQVGYMVLGIGTGNPIGVAGGLFHMLNNAIYKSCLFLGGGAVEEMTGTSELDKLGGLARYMPFTFFSFLIASLSISGVPPFNGFVSKWMIYQGLIQKFTSHQSPVTSILCLVAAMFGSALTLASFMKLLHAVFLGQREEEKKEVREVSSFMWIPQIILALLCVVFGIFAYAVPLKYFIDPAVGGVKFIGIWIPGIATILIMLGMAAGFLIYLAGNWGKNVRRDAPYIGTELISAAYRPTGVDFYNTVRETGKLKWIYQKAEAGFFDLYEQGKKFIFSVSGVFQFLHNGILPTYLVWCLLGMIGLFYTLLLR